MIHVAIWLTVVARIAIVLNVTMVTVIMVTSFDVVVAIVVNHCCYGNPCKEIATVTHILSVETIEVID